MQGGKGDLFWQCHKLMGAPGIQEWWPWTGCTSIVLLCAIYWDCKCGKSMYGAHAGESQERFANYLCPWEAYWGELWSIQQTIPSMLLETRWLHYMTAQQNSHLCWMVLMMRLKAKNRLQVVIMTLNSRSIRTPWTIDGEENCIEDMSSSVCLR